VTNYFDGMRNEIIEIENAMLEENG